MEKVSEEKTNDYRINSPIDDLLLIIEKNKRENLNCFFCRDFVVMHVGWFPKEIGKG